MKLKVGDSVEWKHRTSDASSISDFPARGKILEIFKTTVGAVETVQVAKVKPATHKYWKEINRGTTCISLRKLNKI